MEGRTLRDKSSLQNKIIIDRTLFNEEFCKIRCLAVSTDQELLITGGEDKFIRIYNAKTRQLVIKIAVNATTLVVVLAFNVCPAEVTALALSENSTYFASALEDCSVCIWTTRNCTCIHLLKGHKKAVQSLCFSPSGYYLCSGSWDNTANLWLTESGQLLRTFTSHTNLIQAVAVSRCSLLLATGSWDWSVCVWTLPSVDAHSQSELCYSVVNKPLHRLQGHTGNVYSVAFSKLGMLASGSWDGTVRLWSPGTGRGQCLFVLSECSNWVRSVAFSSDAFYVAAACDDGSVNVWDCADGKRVHAIESTDIAVKQCTFDHRRSLILVGEQMLF